MHVGDMRHSEPWYIDSPRDVCWRSGNVATDDFMMFVPFPIVYTVDGWWTKLQYIGIPDARAGDQLNAVLYAKKQELT